MRLPAELVASLRPAYEGATVCVTGGCGFIGSHTVDALVALGARVAVIDDLSNSDPDHLLELVDLEPERVRFIDASILDPAAMAEAARGANVVIHLAAIGSVPRSIIEPRRVFSVNAAGTVAVLEAARAAGARRFVLASSSSVYGGGEGARHEAEPTRPRSPYAASKVAAEAAVQAWCASYGLTGVSLRYFNVFGPRQSAVTSYAAVVPAFIKNLIAGLPPVIFGDGRQSRDFTYIANVVAANLLAGVPEPRGGLDGQPVNIGTGTRATILEIAQHLAERCGNPQVRPRFEPARGGDVRDSLADIALAKRLLGYEPLVDLTGGLDETVNWARRAMAGA